MNEYDKIAELTKQYLEGNLHKLTMEFSKPSSLTLSIVYEDDHDTTIEYDVQVDPKQHITSFLGHKMAKVLYKVTLDRDVDFEEAICDYFCKCATI
jgi:hypothetical protein